VSRLASGIAAAGASIWLAATAVAAPDAVSDWQAKARLERVQGDLRQNLDRERAAYGREIEARPYDAVLQVSLCRFLDLFSYTYEYVEWIDDVYALAEDCSAELTGRFPAHPETVLFELESLYDDEAVLQQGEAVLAGAPRDWTAAQLARLHVLMAYALERLGRDDASRHSLRALELDRAADVRVQAAGLLIAEGENARALEVLTSPFGGHDASEGWYQLRKMELLARLGAREQVERSYSALLEGSAYYDSLSAAHVLRDSGALDLARSEFERASGAGNYLGSAERERFKFEFEHGTGAQALAAYAGLRDLGWGTDPLGIDRVSLHFKDPGLPWQPRDWLGLAGFALASLAIAAIVGLPVGLVHYRGLARRLRSGYAYPAQGWQLRHAWTTMFLFATSSLLAFYLVGEPAGLTVAGPEIWGFDATAAQIAKITLIETLLGILLLLPVARLAAVRHAGWRGTDWSIAKSLLIGLGFALLFRVPLLLIWAAVPEISTVLDDSILIQVMIEVRERFGIVAAFWVIGIAAPVVEEFVFRGVLLRAFANHISFGWANVLQAALFSAMHMEAAAAPFLFLLGIAAGVMARRSGGLLAAMILHAAFNIIGGLAFLM
jgi:hypothetical protein